MNKELKYNGHTASPSDYECPDGDLSVLLDMWPENGVLKPVLKPGEILTLTSGYKVVSLHEISSSVSHYIVYNTSNNYLYWIDKFDTNHTLHSIENVGVYTSINVIGNIVMLFTTTGTRYYKWDVSSYINLGILPELQLQFGLRHTSSTQGCNGSTVYSGNVTLTGNYSRNPSTQFLNGGNTLSSADQESVTTAILAKVNQAVADNTADGFFIMPFFVRYAFRLFDGTTTRASAPILMLPTTKAPFLIRTYSGDTFNFYVRRYLLEYVVKNSTELAKVQLWKDIIKSVDIFVSAPIYNYDQSGTCKRILAPSYYNNTSVGAFGKGVGNGFFHVGGGAARGDAEEVVSMYDLNEGYSNTGINYVNRGGTAYFELPQFDDEKEFYDKFRNVQKFYLYHSIPVSELASVDTYTIGSNTITYDFKTIARKPDYLPSLVNKETLVDDYDSHDNLIAKGGVNYNSRMNLFGITKKKYSGFPPVECFQRTTGFVNYVYVEDGYYTSDYEEGRGESTQQYWVDTSYYSHELGVQSYIVDCYVHIKTNGVETVVKSDSAYIFSRYGFPRWFYYPDVNAFKAVFVVKRTGTWTGLSQSDMQTELTKVDVFELPLTPHDFLTGAYYFNNLEVPDPTYSGFVSTYASLAPSTCKPFNTQNDTLAFLSKIYTSDVNNPFLYSVGNINTIGSGEILGISTAAKALSQGQFGQFPLYAFTTDGVWALEVSSTTGAFSAKQPITRDVCLNAESITQLDNAVLFVTERGIMFISGSETMCVSEAIDNKNDAVFSTLPQMSQIMLGGQSLTFVSFKTFLSGARIIYDYTSQRVIVFNPSYSYAYIYSRQMKLWAMMRSKIVSAVKSYPEALAMTSDNKLIDFSQRVANTTSSGASSITQLLVTRPLKLDLSDELKTIDNIIQRGNFVRGHVQTLLWGSRDLQNWFPVFSSTDHYLRGFRGTPYKYFRIGLKCNLLDSENLAGCSVQFDVKENNQPR